MFCSFRAGLLALGQWNLHYAGRIRFIVKDADGESRCLRAHLDPVPLTPAVVVLEASVGSVLQPLAGVLREHGHLPPATVEKRLREEVEELLKEAEARKEGRYYRPRQTGVSTERPWREIPLCLSDATLSGMKFKRRDSGAGRKYREQNIGEATGRRSLSSSPALLCGAFACLQGQSRLRRTGLAAVSWKLKLKVWKARVMRYVHWHSRRALEGTEVPDLDLNVLPPVLPKRTGNSHPASVTKKVWRKIVYHGSDQASANAFAALCRDGSVVSWGSKAEGGDSRAVQEQLKGIEHLQATEGAFAAIREDGLIVTWGAQGAGGDSGRHRLLRAGEVGGQARRAAKFWDWFYGSRLQPPEGCQAERPEAAGTEWISQPGTLLPKLLEAFHRRCPETILEIGCGDSSLAQQLHEKLGGAMLAVDISEEALRRAAERAAGRSGLRFAVADATDLGHLFEDGDVGAVVDKGLADTLQFRARTRESRALRRALFAEVYRILAPGGVYAMVTPKVRPQYLHTVEWDGVETSEVEEPKGLLFDLASRGDPGATAPCARAYLHLCRKPGAPEQTRALADGERLPCACSGFLQVFGADGEGGEGGSLTAQDCAICMSERRDTAVLPCRHISSITLTGVPSAASESPVSSKCGPRNRNQPPARLLRSLSAALQPSLSHELPPAVLNPTAARRLPQLYFRLPVLAMAEQIAEGVTYDTLAREWRCKWSFDDDMASLKACQKLVEDMQNDMLAVVFHWAGKQLKTKEVMNGKTDPSKQTIQRLVILVFIIRSLGICKEDTQDFKIIIKLPQDKFQEWEKTNFEPEAQFLEALRAIPGVSEVDTQTYTLEAVNLMGKVPISVPKAANGCMAEEIKRLSLKK
eukprot:s2300_g4.t4